MIVREQRERETKKLRDRKEQRERNWDRDSRGKEKREKKNSTFYP